MITKSPALQKNIQLQITKRIIRQTYKLYKWLKSPCKGELREQVLKAMRREITQNISHLRSRKPKVHGPQIKDEVETLPKRRPAPFIARERKPTPASLTLVFSRWDASLLGELTIGRKQ